MTDLPPIPGLNPLLNPLPAKWHSLRPHQLTSIIDILDAFNRVDVVVYDAPVGSGKSAVATVIALMLQARSVYICHNRDLQQQFLSDVPYARLLEGRANYPVDHPFPDLTCADCTLQTKNGEVVRNCELCDEPAQCAYKIARLAAIKADLAVLNMNYWLRSRAFDDRDLVICDEVDVLEKVLMGEVEVNISARYQKDLDIQPPARMTKQDSHLQWSIDARETVTAALSQLVGDLDVKQARRKEHLETLAGNLDTMAHDIANQRPWVYCGGAGSDRRSGEEIVFKPVEVSSHGLTRIWGRGKKFLLMSGSVISAGMLTRSLGLDRPYEIVSIPSTFPAKNRQVVVTPVANMTRAGQAEGSLPVLVRAVERVLDEHPSDRVLIHTVSYQLAEGLAEGLAYLARPILTYRTAKDRQQALSDFKTEHGAVLLAPSMDRGIDLPDDDCRVQILVKVPYPSLGDKQIAERLYNTKDGAAWYNVVVARTVLQMSGRGVRHIDDHCVSIILDSSFVGWYGRWQHLFSPWFRAAVRFEKGE